jgi:hypothetical protein
MPRSAKRRHQQMNLPLLTARNRPVVSGDQQKELTLTLVELLISAAHNRFDASDEEGDDDVSETHA